MFGLIYFIIVTAIAIVASIEYHILRKRSRNDALKRGHLDYVDYKGKQWYGDRRAVYKYKDGKEYLVDQKKPDIVYIDITKEKEREYNNNPFVIDQRKEAYINFMRCCGSAQPPMCVNRSTKIETETELPFELNEDIGTYYYQPQEKVKNQNIWLDKGDRQKISKERYDFLKGIDWKNDTEEQFLARKKYMDDHTLFQKCGYGAQKAYRIELEKDPQKKGKLRVNNVFVCGKNPEEAKRIFMENWCKYCGNVLLDSITVTEIGV